jgi:RNA polymerase sigma-70 factor (family 1)
MVGKAKEQDFSDDRLFSLIKKGNEIAFAQLFERYWETLLDTAYKVVGDKDGAQDIVQEVFTAIWNKRSSLDITNIPAYLHQSTRHQVFTYIRRNRMVITDFSFLEGPIQINDTEEQVNFNELSSRIEDSISSLPEQRQKVFRLSRFEHLSNKEIAGQLNISVRTVENHISKALETLRLQYSDSLWLLIVFSSF